jgi:DNA-binding response OmpR family regulator
MVRAGEQVLDCSRSVLDLIGPRREVRGMAHQTSPEDEEAGIGPPGLGATRRVLLVGLDPRRAGPLALAFGGFGFVATLAFDRDQLGVAAQGPAFDLVVTTQALLDEGGALLELAARAGAMLVLGGAADDVRSSGAAVVSIPRDARAREVVLAGIGLLGRVASTPRRVTLQWGPVELDVARREARCRGNPVSLTKLQFRLLEALVEAEGAVVSREYLDHVVFGSAPVDDGERIHAHVRRLRSKLELDRAQPSLIVTVRGEGYRLAGEAEAPTAAEPASEPAAAGAPAQSAEPRMESTSTGSAIAVTWRNSNPASNA